MIAFNQYVDLFFFFFFYVQAWEQIVEEECD